MKKFLQQALSLLALCLVSLSAAAQSSVTIDLTQYGYNGVTEGPITATYRVYDANGAEIYGDGSHAALEIATENYAITKIEFSGLTPWGTSHIGIKASVGAFDVDEEMSSCTWTYDEGVDYVKFTAKDSGRDDFYVRQITVYYKAVAATSFRFSEASPLPGEFTSAINGFYMNHEHGVLAFAEGKSVADITVNGEPIPSDTPYTIQDGYVYVGYSVDQDGYNSVKVPEGVFVTTDGLTNKEFSIWYTLRLPYFPMSSAEWATYTNPNSAWVMPEGYTGYIVTGFADGKANAVKTFEAGSTVPAAYPVLINGEAKAKVFVTNVAEAPAAPAVNYLYGNNNNSAEQFIGSLMYLYMSQLAEGEDCYVYKLSYDNNGQNLGFYWEGNSYFGNFVWCEPGRAALVAPKSAASSNGLGIRFVDDTVTGIDAVATEQADVIYNLQGQRVAAPAQGGVYVKNGKKFIVK